MNTTANHELARLGLDGERVRAAVERLEREGRPRYRRLWAYFRNAMRVCGARDGGSGDRPYRQAQEWGLPARITGRRSGVEPFADAGDGPVPRKEVVIENDIGWRVDTMADYLFGKPLVVSSAAPDPARRAVIGRLLRGVLAQNGGLQFLQQLAVTGAVYGFVDVLVKFVGGGGDGGRGGTNCGTRALGEAPVSGDGGIQSPPDEQTSSEARAVGAGPDGAPGAAAMAAADPGGGGGGAVDGSGHDVAAGGDVTAAEDDALVERVARMIRLEIVEPSRALPLLSCEDYRVIEGYGQVWEVQKDEGGRMKDETERAASWWARLKEAVVGEVAPLRFAARRGRDVRVVELITARGWARMEDGRVVASGGNSLGEIPVAHVQNAAAAFEYAGPSDVEPLIPLQDELNTRLSDRAHRITMQSFKMYLAKGIESFTEQPVAPGRMWMTENERASIDEFGGDASCPSEEAHIADVREAMDKASGVTPIAAGAIKNRIGRLTSAAALRVTLLALLSKTDKKRTVYGAGIERVCELALRWLDVAGVFKTTEAERKVELHWPSPLPENDGEKLAEAEAKLRVGVERGVVLRELGY